MSVYKKGAIQQFVGNGTQRSCNRCLQHRNLGGGWRRLLPWGLVCPACVVELGNRKSRTD